MADIGAIVLHKLLQQKDLEGWSKLKLSFFDASYTSVYSAINRYYTKYNKIPDFEELDIYIRDAALKQNITLLKDLEVPEEIDLNIAIDSLINEYTQNVALKGISKFVDRITLLDSDEVKEDLNALVISLDEKTHTNENIVTADSINIFEPEENTHHTRVALGLNNTFDAEVGAFRSNFMVFGGRRGEGKSLVCCNVSVNQYEQGNVVPYFTVEMTAPEIFQRQLGIIADVSAKNIRNNHLSFEEVRRLAKARADMFEDGLEEYNKFLEHKDRFLFEASLRKNCSIKDDGQIVIIHDPFLSLTSIDVHLQKLKAKYKEKLKVAVVDYMNQVVVEGKTEDRYEWKTQVLIATKLKEYAQKHDLLMISAYQIDADNEARFAKGLLDSPDMAHTLRANDKEDGILSFLPTKSRGAAEFEYHSPINWDTLKIYPTDAIKPEKKTKSKKKSTDAVEDSGTDLPF